MNNKNNSGPTPPRSCDSCQLNRDGCCPYINSKVSLAERKKRCPLLKNSYDPVDVNASDDRVEIAHSVKIIPN